MLKTLRIIQSEVFSSSYAAAVYISKVLKLPKDKKVYVIGMEGIEEELDAEQVQHIGGTVRGHGVSFVSLATSPECLFF